MPSIQLSDLAQRLDAVLHGDGDLIITGIASLSSATTGQITFMVDSHYRDVLASTAASAVILKKNDLVYCPVSALVMNNPYIGYAKLAQIFDATPLPANKIAPSAIIDPTAKLGTGVCVGANSIIEEGVVLGENVIIGAGCFIGQNVHIEAGSKVWANVTIYHNAHIGKNCLVQANTVIGSDGFGYANEKGKWVKIPQLGSVKIGNNVEIGACTTIDRGALDDTIIEDGVIIDNQCQIAHNVIIGAHTAIAGGVIMAGSLKIGKHCQIGGASVINGHMEICDGAVVTGMGMVMRPIKEPGVYSSGIPLQPNKAWRKTAALVMNIDTMNKKLKALEQKIHKNNTQKS